MQSARSAPTTRARRTGSDAKTASRAAVSDDECKTHRASRNVQSADSWPRRSARGIRCRAVRRPSRGHAPHAHRSRTYMAPTYLVCCVRCMPSVACCISPLVAMTGGVVTAIIVAPTGSANVGCAKMRTNQRKHAHEALEAKRPYLCANQPTVAVGQRRENVQPDFAASNRPARDTMPCRIPCGMIPCCAGYHAVRDTMPGRLGCALS